MKLTDPCGFCHRTLRPGDGFHEVMIAENDPSGREPGKYNNVCGECAGLEYTVPPIITKKKRDKTQRCGVCKRAMRKGTVYQRLRIEDIDDTGLEAGLHALCQSCYNKYKDVVHARTGGKDF